MKAKPALPERVRSIERLGVTGRGKREVDFGPFALAKAHKPCVPWAGGCLWIVYSGIIQSHCDVLPKQLPQKGETASNFIWRSDITLSLGFHIGCEVVADRTLCMEKAAAPFVDIDEAGMIDF